MPAEADALPGLKERHVWSHSIDDPGDLVTRNPGILDSGEKPQLGNGVAVTHAASLYADAHLPGAGIGEFAFDQLKLSAGSRHLRGTTFD